MAWRVEPLAAGEVGAAALLLARAFHHETHFTRILPEPRRRARTLTALMRLSIRDAHPFGHVYTARAADDADGGDGADLAAVAVWLPPQRFPLSRPRQLRATPDIARMAVRAGPRIGPLMRFASTLAKLHPAEPHWYLVAIGADPDRAGAGAGSAVLRAGTARADAAGQTCYLETQEESTVRWYERAGFAADGPVLDFPEGFRSWQMLRAPQK